MSLSMFSPRKFSRVAHHHGRYPFLYLFFLPRSSIRRVSRLNSRNKTCTKWMRSRKMLSYPVQLRFGKLELSRHGDESKKKRATRKRRAECPRDGKLNRQIRVARRWASHRCKILDTHGRSSTSFVWNGFIFTRQMAAQRPINGWSTT